MPIKHLKVNRYSTNYTKKILNGGSQPKQPKVSGGIKPRHDPSRAGFRTQRPVVQSGVSGVSPPQKQQNGPGVKPRSNFSRAGFKRKQPVVRSGVSGVSIPQLYKPTLTGYQSNGVVKQNIYQSPVIKPNLRPKNTTQKMIIGLLSRKKISKA